ncbi:glycerophosphodiester phosphodiesterase GDE1 [Metarhizium album ARSEF 1941]|uniref:Glycerophosphodiester phosphodiesterase GDE1 n=1 Tax=Metarhizium album (strain ARSEF 1941) TaxID=1081103 RepID=A0A0B2WZN8_METAS|nr:glycerophosphodiester phosphodiesterase GDE1 [Metarhizium album ARSEF 1941]KHN98285.1 glycerophosphodiester phosphodiesterase GDE1 [Metarhizium album ARSEF 1941]
MKFGRNLPRNQVPEWAASYINYKGLKKLVKALAQKASNGETVDPAELFFALDRNLEDVDSFYNKKFAEACRRLNILHNRYGRVPDVVATLDQDEVEEVMGALLELRTQLRNLQWFGEINRRGFVKITKKLDKRVPQISYQHRYISTKVDPKQFAKDGNIGRLLAEINRWLSVLSDARQIDDSKSDRSTRSLGRASAKAMSNLPQDQLDILDHAVRSDDVSSLKCGLADANIGQDSSAQTLLLNLLQRSISARSRQCITYLLTQAKDLDEPDDINGRNCIHRLVIHIGRTKSSAQDDRHLQPAVSSAVPVKAINTRESNLLSANDEAVQLLIFLLDQLGQSQRLALMGRDSLGRLPLHYAAQFGFVVVCQIIMKYMQDWNQFDAKDGIDAPEWHDSDGFAPLHLSVIGGHPLTTKALLQGENWQGSSEAKVQIRKTIPKSGASLALATKSNYEPIVQMLVDAGVDINWTDKTGETALHIAARFSHEACARIILRGSNSQKADIEVAENSYSWTPLHVAAVDGSLCVVQLLVDAGADVSRPDASGWTAKEHAALRGHMDIARFLAAHTNEEEAVARVAQGMQQSNPPENSSIDGRRSNVPNSNTPRPAEPVKTFGHRYLTDESLVLVSLGTMDIRKATEAIHLDSVPLAEAHSTQLDTALSVVVSANGAHGDPTTIDLPVHEGISTEPIVFKTVDTTKVTLLFDIIPTYSGSEKNKIGRAVAMLSSVKPTIGSRRMNLQGDVCVPIVSSNLEVIGTVNFNFLVITPFSHPNIEITSRQTYWRKLSSTMLIGHRGLGKNLTSNKSLQLGENTLPSFIAAANLGAQYVEFDVQLTKDHVPVIYHDFLVSETGIDAPVHTLTLEQFLHINPDRARDRAHKNGANRDSLDDLTVRPRSSSFAPPKRSLSMGYAGTGNEQMEERMKHTRDFKAKGYKANSRGNFIQAPFATLEDLFRQLPEEIGFNMELKYPMLHESEAHEMDTYAVELNSFCDTVLSKVYDLVGNRHIIFSSFNPDICLCLSFKQPSIPILFLTDAGCSPVGDIRASSLQEAIRFASRWNLLGIVSAAEPLINSPRLVRVVKEIGLVCVSYGVLNNDPLMVQRQVKEGIDAVIVDSVLAIRKGLTSGESTGDGSDGSPTSEDTLKLGMEAN